MAIFNVLEYGATPNDDTVDSAAIQAAIDAAYAAGGGTVYIPAGTFLMTGNPANSSDGCIEVRSNVTLTGAGIGETVLKLVDHFDARINGMIRTPVDQNASNVVIENLTIDGNRANNIEHQAGIITGVKEGNGLIHQDITIRGVEVMNCNAYGVNPHEITYDLLVENCISHDNGKDGFVADYVEGGIYRNNIAYNNVRHGFNITTSSNDLVLENNTAYQNGGAGLVTQRSDIFPEGQDTIPWPANIMVIGGEYYANAREGILIKLSDHVTVTGADIHDNKRQGIRIEGATNTVIHDNTVYNNSQEANGVYDEINIRLRVDTAVSPSRTYYSENTQIYDNIIYADGAVRARYGIREETTNSTADNPSGTVVYGNTVTGEVSGDIFIPPHSATEGADIFYGTASGDNFAGLGGDDIYIVNHSLDVVTEQLNAGHDTVIASLNHTLSANVEDLFLTGTAIRGTGNALANEIVGNALANELEGLGGADILDGGLGADLMQGGDGNDTYFVDNVGDTIVEKDNLGAGGYDTVYSTVSYTLATEVEKLVLLGTGNLDGTGNASANALIGNDGNNVLDGKAGADSMTGGKGNDTYVIDHTGDTVIELADEGIDTVVSSLTYVLGANLENLTLTGTLNRDATGNELSNVIKGNDGVNKIHGMDGDDVIEGGLGADQLYGDAGNDTFILRKGEFAGDVIEDFTGKGAALGDSIVFTGFSSAAVLVDLGSGNWMVQDGSYTETFRIKTPVGEVAFSAQDYGFGTDVVIPQNTAPTASATGNSASGDEDTLISGSVPAGSDAENDALTYVQVGSVSGLTLNANGSFSYQPPANATGPVNFSYMVVDAKGAQSAAQTFTITVNPVNDAPTAASAGNTASGNEDTTITGSVPTGSDIDGDALTYVQVGTVAGLTLNANGTFSYVPDANANGPVTFNYAVRDPSGAQSAAQAFTITVNAVNDAPTAASSGNTASGNEDTTITGSVPTGSDIDGDALTYVQVGTVAGLTLNANGTFSYVPAANANGPVTFNYAVRDPSGAQSAAQAFTITVVPVNDAPTAAVAGNAASGQTNTVITGNLPTGADIDGDAISYALVSGLSGLTLNPNGSFSYTPASGATGDFTFQYKVVDPLGAASAAQSFTISVTPPSTGQVITGTNSSNILHGGAGDDTIDGLKSSDTMYGHAGNDTYYVDASGDKVIEVVGEGYDRVITTASYTLQAGSEVEYVKATGTSSVSLKGNEFNNVLIGNAASNTLTGNNGDDRLDGGLGKDSLTGGNGKDSFVFSTALSAANVDAIKDFKVVDDTIVLDKAIFSALSTGQLSAAEFVTGTQALDANDHIIYNKTSGILLYDADGAGGAAAIQFATISKNLAMTYLDFVVEDTTLV
ncbi:tandem-95 repeat protein [Rhizobium sp. AG855]|uniref:tandem-95 repeat protein n=1 Tax=Rhizobium sp. AG855 TaxID=2183898 RepID=UPI000E726EB7|nr:tandem-95 repeat protein [Rhizobium sp. AG855]RKE80250.1 parallel beta-helix repeat protein [Rhizobium sp. AG855]